MMMLRRKTDPKTGKHTLCELAQSKCTWTCHILRGNLQGKCRTPSPRPAFCASLRGRNAHGHLRRAILCRNLQEKCWTPIPRQSRNTRFVRACAFEMHVAMSQESFILKKFLGEMPNAFRIPPRLNTGPEHLYRKNP